ncbi:pickpocket protein 19-like isoform X1 [Hylaeus anthracinus]|uniref:pickpocket protein 19-like isoform X1 n=1 Tax=Hylaeus anthracinus TaxID=313031 RepID=UPI0023BA1E96|nr:pickpocket protein 19-like isoform X1 [Hylaeus anthracinus]
MSKIPKEHDYFYNEILPDFRIRETVILNEKKSVLTDDRTRVGMQTINPKSKSGKYFVEFASGSTIHGLKHLVAPHRHPIEKILAVLFIFGALLCLIYLSFLFWDRYQNYATVIVVDNERDQFEVSKPALFVCPVPNVNDSKLPDVFKKHGVEHTSEAEEFFTFLANVNYQTMSQTPNFDKVPPNKWLGILYDLRRYLPRNVGNEEDPLEAWVVTERGFCLAKRNVFAVYATYEYWMSNNWTVVPIPTNVSYYDHNDDRLQTSVFAMYIALLAVSDPFEVLLYDVPTTKIVPQLLQRLIMSISAIKTDPTVKELQISQRKCKFHNDGGLKTWPVYTRNMCKMECRMRVIEDRCKCRPHFARPIEGVNVCNAEQLRCIGKITKDLFLFEHTPYFCDCDPNCDLVTYQISEKDVNELNQVPTNSSFVNLIVELPQIVYHRSLMFGFTDFLTGVGGAAGLFLGASVLSFVEIIYYGTFHICFYLKRVSRSYNKDKTVNLS